MDPIDLVLSIAVLDMIWVKGGGGLVRGLILLCVLYISLSVGPCGSANLEEWRALSRFDCSLGEAIVLLFMVMASCLSDTLV